MPQEFKDESEALDFLHQALNSDTYAPEKLARPSPLGPEDPTPIVRDVPVPPDSKPFPATPHVDSPEQRADIQRRGWTDPDAGAREVGNPNRAIIIEKKPEAPPEDELATLQAFAARRRRSSALGQAGANFADALTTPNARTSNGWWDKWGEEGDHAVADYKARKVEGEAKAAKAKADALEAAMKDANSPESRQAVAMALNLHPSLSKFLTPGTSTGAQAAKVLPFLPTLIKESGDTERAGAAAKERTATEDRHKAEEVEKNEREKIEEEDRFKRNDAAANTRNQIMADATFGKETRAEVRQEEKEARADERQTDKEKREAQFGIPKGYVAHGHPTNEQKNKFSVGIGAAEKLKLGVAEVRVLLKKTGGMDRLVGADARSLDRIVTQLAIEGKNVAELGALSGPDFALMAKLVQNPTEFGNWLRDDAERAMTDLESWADRQVAGAEKSFNIYKEAAEGKAGPPEQQTKPSPGRGWTRGSVKGRPGWVSPDKTEFEAD